MAKKPKFRKPACLHCEIVSILERRHPGGMDFEESSEALRCLALIAADILQHAEGAAYEGFMIAVDEAIAADIQELTIIPGARH